MYIKRNKMLQTEYMLKSESDGPKVSVEKLVAIAITCYK